MGMCLDGGDHFSIEVCRESFKICHDDNHTNIREGCNPEYKLEELDDLIESLMEAKRYVAEKSGNMS